MKHIKLFEDFDNNQYGDVQFGKDVIAITKLLKKMTVNDGKYNFTIGQSQAKDIDWQENNDRPSWSITLYAFGEYAGICYISIDKERTKMVIKSSKDLKAVLDFIKKQSKIIKPTTLSSKYGKDDVDIHNMLSMTTLSIYININKL
jgi:hypothetical protein